MEKYPSRESLMTKLAGIVAGQLEDAINERGRASLAVPGGSTPEPFLRALSLADIDWRKVYVLLGDERFVAEDSVRSNTKLLKETLFQNNATHANYMSMTKLADRPEDVIDELAEGVEDALPLDVLVVGMGEDMHTASLFPDSPDLEHALRDDAPILAVIRAPNAGEPRITLTAPVLKSARHKHVLLAGQNKLEPLAKAQNLTTEIEAPIRTVISGENPAMIHYAD